MRGVVRALAGASAILVAALPLGAQRVSGTLRLPGGNERLGGILVVAKDSAGVEFARAVTSEDGRFALPLPRAGYAKIDVLRVGFENQSLADKVFAGGEAMALDVELVNRHAAMPTRGTNPPSSCQAGRDARYVDMLWEEVRKALTTTQVGLSRQGVVGRWATTDHRLAANQRDTTRFSVLRRSGALLAAFGSPVLGELQRSGYVVTAGQDRIFRGLDVPALLSTWFRDSYCFTAVDGSSTTFVVEFQPKVRRRDYVDITGEIIISRATMELLTVKYLYVGLPSDEDKRGAGGQLNFGRTDGGTWLVNDWTIRFPQVGMMELQTFRSADRGRVMNPEVLGVEVLGGYTTALMEGTRRIYSREVDAENGAELAPAMRTACGERILASPTGAARGRLTLDGRPVSGSRIRATWRAQRDIGGEVPLWRDEIREALSTNRGDWVLCDLPHNTTVELSWEIQGRRSTFTLETKKDVVLNIGLDGRVVAEP